MPQEQGIALKTDDRDWWTIHRGASPVLGTAIHNGHEVNPALEDQMALAEIDRLREEDPFTEFVIRDLPNRIAFHRSRFAIDLNRARGEAVYLSPEQSWGLEVWADEPTPEMVEQSLQMHDHYYLMLKTMLRELEEQYGHFIVLDIHSYNHRRDGPDAPATDPHAMPEINIGTYSMNRPKWAHVVDPFMEKLREFEFRGHRMDVRENVAFQGKGEQTRFIHDAFPQTGCAIAMFLVGIDIVGDKILEINVFTPGGLWSICDMYGTDFAETVVQSLEKKLEMREGSQGTLTNRELAIL